MHWLSSLALPVLLAATATATPTANTAKRVVPISIEKIQGSYHQETRRLRRRAHFDESLENNRTGYFAVVDIGTPPQSIKMHVDTGSTDVWVLSKSVDLCNSKTLQNKFGNCYDTFDEKKSSTFETAVPQGFTIKYLDGTGAAGDYFNDSIDLGGALLKNMQMGIAYNSTNQWAMMGVGYSENVNADTPFPGLIEQLVIQKMINVKAYSLWLNDVDSATGTILFGGIDTEKFTGTLKSLPVLPDPETNKTKEFNVALSSISVVNQDRNDVATNGTNISVLLDSGTTLTYLPKKITTKIFAALKAVEVQFEDESTDTLIDCALETSPIELRYQFGGADGPIVSVPLSDLILGQYRLDGPLGITLPFPENRVCKLGIQSAEDFAILGDTFLRSAYVVYDMTHNQVAMAQAIQNATKSNVVEIDANAPGIPLVTGAAVGKKDSAAPLALTASATTAALVSLLGAAFLVL